MSNWAIWFVQEGIKLLIERLNNLGSLDGITEEQAKAEIERLTLALPAQLPSPEELEGEI